MLKKHKNAGILIGFIIGQLLLTFRMYTIDPYAFELSSHLFFWSLFELFLALSLIFGFENRGAFSLFSIGQQAPYDHNAANFIGHTSKNYYTRFLDLSTGLIILGLSCLNLIGYFVFTLLMN